MDTNVLVSALLNPIGAPGQLLLLLFHEPDIQLYISPDVFAEYEEVIRRPRFQRSGQEIESALGWLKARSIWVKPHRAIYECTDADDNIFLECADAAKAHYLVTGNIRHFPAAWQETRIVTARQFLDWVP